MAGDLPDREQMLANVPTTAMTVVEDQPFVERVSPFDIYIDPEATCIEDATVDRPTDCPCRWRKRRRISVTSRRRGRICKPHRF